LVKHDSLKVVFWTLC